MLVRATKNIVASRYLPTPALIGQKTAALMKKYG